MTNLKEGDVIPDVAAMEALPVGTAVTHNGSRKLVTRHPDGWARHNDGTRRYTARDYWYRGIQIVSLPQTYNGPLVGATITGVADLAQLPVGAVITQVPRGGIYQREGNGLWDHGFDDDGLWQSIQRLTYQVERLPLELFETPEQFAWRFRDLSITGEERALGTHTSSTTILDRLGIAFKPSVGLRVTSKFDRALIPEGSRVYVGDPEKPETFGLYRRVDGRWEKVFGDSNLAPNDAIAVVIDALPDKTEPDEWLVAAPTQEQMTEVQMLRAKAWKAGHTEKVSRGWCDEFERIMLRGGLTAESAVVPLPGGVKQGDIISPEQAAALPVGMVLRYEDEEGWAVFKRADGAGNRAGTIRVAASPGWNRGNFRPQMVLASSEPETAPETAIDFIMSIHSTEELAGMPVGTQIRAYSNPRQYIYTRLPATNGAYHWSEQGSPDVARYQHTAFRTGRGYSQYYYSRIGAAQ